MPRYGLTGHYSLSDLVPPCVVATKARSIFGKIEAGGRVQSMGGLYGGNVGDPD